MNNPGTDVMVGELERVQVVEANPLSFFMENYDEFARMSKQLAESGMYRHTTSQAVGAILLYALEMKIPVTHALRGMYHIPGGSLGMEGQLMLGLARNRCGVSVHDIERSREAYSATLHRDDERHPVSFTVEQAVTAGLLVDDGEGGHKAAPNARGKIKTTWNQWREDMLQWRALSQGLRVIAPDIFLNIYSAEEALQLQAKHHEAHKHDASDELHEAKLQSDIDDLRDLVKKVEEKYPDTLNYDDRQHIDEACEQRDSQHILGWIDSLVEMLAK